MYAPYVTIIEPGIKLTPSCLTLHSNNHKNSPSRKIKYSFYICIMRPIHMVCDILENTNKFFGLEDHIVVMYGVKDDIISHL